jgi:hypothetical protein
MASSTRKLPEPLVHWPAVATTTAISLLGLSLLITYLHARTRPVANFAASQASPVSAPEVQATPSASQPPFDPIMPRIEANEEPMPEAAPARAETPRTAPAPPPRPVPAALVFKRRDQRTTDELGRLLLAIPEISLDSTPGASDRVLIASRAQKTSTDHLMPALFGAREDLAGLPFRMGLDCQLGKESAENLQVLSRRLRAYLKESVANGNADPRHDVRVLREKLLNSTKPQRCEWVQTEALPTLVQMLQVEEKPVRLLLVELLSHMKGRRPTTVLAQRALFDLDEDVREAAVTALRDRPAEEYRPILLSGFRYPWEPVADHAAEALVALGDRDSVPRLVDLLDQTNPNAPDYSGRAYKAPLVRELVRVNHLRNCLLCHPASFSVSEPARGRIPSPGQTLDPPENSYGGTIGTFVRADVTYLKADFSVMQPVANAGHWPVHQRYDYVVRTREATPFEVAVMPYWARTRPQREAAAFAIRELAGEKANVAN